MDIFELETKYLTWKEAYYNGEPLGSDDEFDEMEELLKTLGSDVINVVGSPDRNFKHQHLSTMNSLDKIQADLAGNLPFDQIANWFSKFPIHTEFEASTKYDGMAINLIYRTNGVIAPLERAITRGNKERGKDATAKLIRKVPLFIESTNDLEIRGECVIPLKIFNEKYLNHPDENVRKYSNPRNFVAGVVGRDETNEDLLNEIQFMAVEARIHDGDYEFPDDTDKFLWEHGFNKKDHYTLKFEFNKENFQKIYDDMKHYRENVSPFQLDGFVVKAPEHLRKEFGETGHHPNWAIAIKFPPKQAKTSTLSIVNRMSITGEIVPVIMLVPTDLDGSVIRKTAGYNWGYILNNGLFPGAKVTIAKSGDIIPIITKIDEPNFNGSVPSTCLCGGKAYMSGIHLLCANEDCSYKTLKKFVNGMGVFGMNKFGGVTRRLIHEAGFTRISQVFDRNVFNKNTLIASGKFKDGKTLNSLLDEMEKLKTVTLAQIILSLGFEGIGSTASKQLAKYIRGKAYSFYNLEKEPLQGFEIGNEKRMKIEELVQIFSNRGVIVEEDPVVINGIGYELTGSPKGAGFPVKEDLVKFLLTHGYVHEGLKTAKVLLTDSMNSPSSKMGEARKRKVPIYTYSDFINKLNDGEKILSDDDK